MKETDFKKNISLKSLNTFRVGGDAKYFFEPHTEKDLIESIKWAQENKVSFFILGGGSNVIFDSRGFNGLVIRSKLNSIDIRKDKVLLGSSVSVATLLTECLKHGLSGLEWASGIPSMTIGGALYMNAGAFGANMADITEKVSALNTDTLEKQDFSFTECQFGYKETVFKTQKNLIILSCILNLEKKDPKEIKKEMDRVIDYRRTNHPLVFPSAGSIFKNPFNISAGQAIEKVGLKGKRMGDAKVSEKHCNFIVNMGQATSKDILSLISLIKKEVKQKLNIELKEEVEIVK